MNPLPAATLRSNRGTWLVPACDLPAVAAVLLDALPAEPFDAGFLGQELETTYFDTAVLRLRKARRRGERYLTLRLRCYHTPNEPAAYAVSAKTEDEKWRSEIPAATAALLLQTPSVDVWRALLPGHLQRLFGFC